MSKILLKYIAAITILLAISACSSGGASRENLNRVISQSYAKVTGVESVQLESEVGKRSAQGVLIGALSNSDGSGDEILIGALVGALIGGGVQKIEEGSNQAFYYQLQSAEQGEFKVLTKQTGLEVGDCVAVEKSEFTKLTKVKDENCT